MKKIPVWLILVLLIAALIAAKFLFFSKKEDKAGNKPKNAMPVAVNYYVVKSLSFPTNVFATGKTGALNQVEITSEIAGKVTAIYFKEGETVSKGSALVKLYDTDLQAQLQKTRTLLKLAEQKLERAKKLLSIKGLSQEEYDTQENEVLVLKADETLIQSQLAKTLIAAPFDGVVGLKNISEGSYVNSSMALVSLIQLRPLFIEFSVPEKYSDKITKGVSIGFQLEREGAAASHSATVYAVEPRVDEVTKTIRARALYNGNTALYPGSFVKVFVDLGQVSNALMVPTQCVIPTLKGQKVFLAKNGAAVETPIKIGVRSDEKIQITEGIALGDTVIVTGLLSLKNESKLKLLKPVQ